MGRKKQSKTEDEFNEEAAKQIYLKKQNEPIPNSDLETIFESNEGESDDTGSRGGRRLHAVAAAAKLSRAPRRLPESKPWLEDKEKTRKRKVMTAQLFKGRKKIKWQGLSEQEEMKLLNIIAASDDVSDHSTDENNPENYQDITSQLAINSQNTDEKGQSAESTSKSSREVLDQQTNNGDELQSSEADFIPDISTSEHSAADRLSDDFIWVPQISREIKSNAAKPKRKSVRRRSSLFVNDSNTANTTSAQTVESKDPRENTPILKTPNVMKADKTENVKDEPGMELAKQILEADSVFGPIGFEDENLSLNTVVNPKRSTLVKKTEKVQVRRSSRFFQHSSNTQETGSVFQEVTIKVRRRLSADVSTKLSLTKLQPDISMVESPKKTEPPFLQI